MGLFVNPGMGSLLEDMNDDIYVDKSLIIAELNRCYGSRRRFVCVSRPRRFGKTMVGNLVAAYYTRGADARGVFGRLKIGRERGWDAHLNRANVVKIDMNWFYGVYGRSGRVVEGLTRDVVAELAAEFPGAGLEPEMNLAVAVVRVYAATGVRFVFIVDEYDVLFRERGVSRADQDEYLSLLNTLFKASAGAEAVALAYLTGILPIARDKVQSKLNNFDEYTMLRPMEMAPHLGFTLSEVRALCDEAGVDYAECLRWYDGYRLSESVSVCNPNSVCMAVRTGAFGDYWNSTGSYRAVSDYVDMNFDGSRDGIAAMLAGGGVRVDVRSFLNTLSDFGGRDDLFTYLVHLGYLAYDGASGECRIPNGEMRGEWVVALARSRCFRGMADVVEASRDLLAATLAADEEAVARGLDRAHQEATSPLTYNNEGSLQSAIGMAYFYARADYNIVREMPAGRGYADMAFLPLRPGRRAFVVELKMAGAPGGAVAQARGRRYADALAPYGGEALIVGVAYDSKTKRHTCKIERIGDKTANAYRPPKP